MRTRYILAGIKIWSVLVLLFKGAESFIKSRYACQGDKLRIRCKSSRIIQIYSANYGRTEPGSSICPSKNIGNTLCKSAEALNIVVKKCTNRARCNVKADNTMFPDPCPNTFKYLDIVYGCVPRPASMTTGLPITRRRRRKSTTTQAAWISTTERITTPTPLPTTNTTLNTTVASKTIQDNTTTNSTTTAATIPTVFVKTQKPTPVVTPTEMSSTKATPPEVSGYAQRGEVPFMNLVVSLYLTYIILSGQPKYVLILFLSGVAIATILLLVLLLGLHLRGRRSKKFEMQTEKAMDPHDDDDDDIDDEDDGVHDDDDDETDDDDENKNVMIEIQGDNEETKQISVKPGDIIIIDSKDVDNDDSEDLGYMSEIVRYYNSRNMVQDDGKQSLTCETPSVNSIPNSVGDKREDLPYDNIPQANGVCVT